MEHTTNTASYPSSREFGWKHLDGEMEFALGEQQDEEDELFTHKLYIHLFNKVRNAPDVLLASTMVCVVSLIFSAFSNVLHRLPLLNQPTRRNLSLSSIVPVAKAPTRVPPGECSFRMIHGSDPLASTGFWVSRAENLHFCQSYQKHPHCQSVSLSHNRLERHCHFIVW